MKYKKKCEYNYIYIIYKSRKKLLLKCYWKWMSLVSITARKCLNSNLKMSLKYHNKKLIK